MILPSGKSGTLSSSARISNDIVHYVDFSNDYGWSGNTANDLMDRSVKYSSPAGYVSVVSGSTAEPGYIELDGSTDYLVAGKTLDAMTTLQNFTIDAWVYPGATTGFTIASFQKVVLTGQTAANQGFSFLPLLNGGWLNPRIQFYTASGGTRQGQFLATAGLTFTKNEWTHIVMRCKVNGDSSCHVTAKVFKPNGLSAASLVAGVTAGSPASTGITSSNAMHIGSQVVGSAVHAYLNGKIGSVRLYNRLLTDSEIETNYERSKKRYGHS
jgi:hypothetical protein